jgi:RNA recognition motif. (a.k.a. RRM, RBD, or RNP domain)
MALRSPLPDVQQSRCLTSICLRIRSCSCKISPRVLARTSSWRSSHSEYHFAIPWVFRRYLCYDRYPNLHEVRLIANKKDIAFVEYMDEGSATVAKEALHNYKLDGENKIKVRLLAKIYNLIDMIPQLDHVRKEVNLALDQTVVPAFEAITVLCISPFGLNVLVYHLTLPMSKYHEIHDETWQFTSHRRR